METLHTLSDEQNDFCINYLKAIFSGNPPAFTELSALKKYALVMMIKAQPELQEELISPLSVVLTQDVLTMIKQPNDPQHTPVLYDHVDPKDTTSDNPLPSNNHSDPPTTASLPNSTESTDAAALTVSPTDTSQIDRPANDITPDPPTTNEAEPIPAKTHPVIETTPIIDPTPPIDSLPDMPDETPPSVTQPATPPLQDHSTSLDQSDSNTVDPAPTETYPIIEPTPTIEAAPTIESESKNANTISPITEKPATHPSQPHVSSATHPTPTLEPDSKIGPVSGAPDIHQIQIMINLLIKNSYKSPKMMSNYLKTVLPILTPVEFNQLTYFLIQSYHDFPISLLNKVGVTTALKFYTAISYFLPHSDEKYTTLIPFLDQFLSEICQFKRSDDQYKLMNYFPPIIIQLLLKRLSMYAKLSSFEMQELYQRFYLQINNDFPLTKYPKMTRVVSKVRIS